jgi:molybdate transport system regulatory protein
MKHGARNEFVGEVTEIKKGELMCSVTLRVPAESRVCSVMTLDSLKALGVKKGDKVKAIVKAVNVLLTTD